MNEFNFKEMLDIKIMRLSQSLWESKVNRGNLSRWLDNFESSKEDAECEQTHAMYLLSNFMYFGAREIRELLKSLYRDKFFKPLIQSVRKRNGNVKDMSVIGPEILQELKATRFLGMGNPSESGTHLLYFFRQENELGKEDFMHSHEILSFDRDGDGNVSLRLNKPEVKRYILLDDVCGSGTQAIQYSKKLVSEMKSLDPNIEVYYFTLFSTVEGMENIRRESDFDLVDCIFELDETFKCFSDSARQFRNEEHLPISQEFAKSFCEKYGINLFGEQHCLGYKGSQLLLGFTHNTPDNTLPIIWGENNWEPLFKRYHKKYGFKYN
ncbi:hypothetical protein AB4581_21460 [Vibrio cyclitrophicus]|nr:hypothetical protein [Vibrio lentus]PMH99324.1 hypothetical protein BCU54_20440 [Vibrio lentus]